MQQEKITNKIFSSVLRDLMKKSELTQEELAGALGVTQSAIFNYLNGRIPKVEILNKISGFFVVTTDELLTGRKPQEVVIPTFEGNRDVEYWKDRAEMAKKKIAELEKKLADIRDVLKR